MAFFPSKKSPSLRIQNLRPPLSGSPKNPPGGAPPATAAPSGPAPPVPLPVTRVAGAAPLQGYVVAPCQPAPVQVASGRFFFSVKTLGYLLGGDHARTDVSGKYLLVIGFVPKSWGLWGPPSKWPNFMNL